MHRSVFSLPFCSIHGAVALPQTGSPVNSFLPCIIHRRVIKTLVHIPEQELAAQILEQCKLKLTLSLDGRPSQ